VRALSKAIRSGYAQCRTNLTPRASARSPEARGLNISVTRLGKHVEARTATRSSMPENQTAHPPCLSNAFLSAIEPFRPSRDRRVGRSEETEAASIMWDQPCCIEWPSWTDHQFGQGVGQDFLLEDEGGVSEARGCAAARTRGLDTVMLAIDDRLAPRSARSAKATAATWAASSGAHQ